LPPTAWFPPASRSFHRPPPMLGHPSDLLCSGPPAGPATPQAVPGPDWKECTMSRTWRILSSALMLLALTASAATAQEGSARRQGFWFNIGFGYGSADFNCDNCGTTDREGSVAGNIGAGGTLSPQLLLGVESNGW